MDKNREDTIIPIVEREVASQVAEVTAYLYLQDKILTKDEVIDIHDNYEVKVTLVRKENTDA